MNGGGTPVWVTVIVARLIGGFAAGLIGVATYAHVSSADTLTTTGQASPWFVFGPTAIGAIATGFALSLLLPRMSGQVVGVFQSIVAAAAGSLFTVILTLLVAGGFSTTTSTGSVMVLSSGAMGVSLFSWIFAVGITTWMVSNASQPADGSWGGGGKHMTSQHSWADKPATDPGGIDLDRRQAERGYWGGLEEPGPDEPNRDN